MNYIEGQALHKVIFGAGVQVCCLIECNSFVTFLFLQLTFEDKVHVSRQICQAMMFMHTVSPPIVHLDIKPENILVIID